MTVIRTDAQANRDAGTMARVPTATAARSRGLDSTAKANETETDEASGELRVDGEQQGASDPRLETLLNRAGVNVGNSGPINASTTTSTAGTNGAARANGVSSDSVTKVANKAEETRLGPVTAPRVDLTPTLSDSAKSFASNVDKVMSNHLRANAGAVTAARNAPALRVNTVLSSSGWTGISINNMSADVLLAEFLKININDPNQNVETQNKLYTLASEMRQLAIEEAKKRIERAQELMREAQQYADQVEKYADMAGMLGIVMGIMGPLGAIMSAIMQIVVAIAQYEAQMMMLDAKEEKNNAERFRLMGDMHQNQVEETSETINTIMETKNAMVESVMQMINASWSTRQQLMSAAMAR